MLSRLKTALRTLLRRSRAERELDEELRYHIEQQTEQNVRLGMNPEEARYAARKAFGGVEQAKERSRGVRWLEELWQDLRYGVRMLVKNPGFTLAAVITLALGIGANTAVFSVVYATLLKPLPYPEAERIYSVEIVVPERSLSLPGRIQDYLEWRKAGTAFSAVAALRPGGWNLTGNGEPERVGGAHVSANFFEFLGVHPALGRGFALEEEAPGADKVIVISDALWRRRYGANPNLVGGTIELNGQNHVGGGRHPARLGGTRTAASTLPTPSPA